uniref:Tetratricopeptide repeat domain 36 n=1 Tax=Hucho hucho TaxID=62062 RepID=A0A4W5R0S8_9TELE
MSLKSTTCGDGVLPNINGDFFCDVINHVFTLKPRPSLTVCIICGFCIPPGALEDLERAIALSGGAGRTACQALVQRGLLLRLACQDDKAREDFEKAAVLGSEFARRQVVVLNPYAALCNRMLTEVINKLRNPEVSETQVGQSSSGCAGWRL